MICMCYIKVYKGGYLIFGFIEVLFGYLRVVEIYFIVYL